MQEISWPYKVFYYTAMSFVLIGIVSGIYSFTRTVVYQVADLPTSSSLTSLFGNDSYYNDNLSDEEKDRLDEKKQDEYIMNYINSVLQTVISVLVFVFLYYYVNTEKFNK
jgi:uncharacterized protein YqhQ